MCSGIIDFCAVGIVELNSFCYNEIIKNESTKKFDPNNIKKQDKIEANKIYSIIFNGGMPELYINKKLKRESFFLVI